MDLLFFFSASASGIAQLSERTTLAEACRRSIEVTMRHSRKPDVGFGREGVKRIFVGSRSQENFSEISEFFELGAWV